jgi:hypothetical protein
MRHCCRKLPAFEDSTKRPPSPAVRRFEISSFSSAAKHQNQKHYERTDQVVENKDGPFFDPSKLVKTGKTIKFSNQTCESIELSSARCARNVFVRGRALNAKGPTFEFRDLASGGDPQNGFFFKDVRTNPRCY